MELLAKLFGSAEKVKIMRLFVLNPEAVYTPFEVAKRSRTPLALVKKELKALEALNFIKTKSFTAQVDPAVLVPELITLKQKKTKTKITKKRGFQLEPSFAFLSQIRSILKSDIFSHRRDFAKRFSRAGKIKFLAIAGIFIDSPDSRADVIVVGDNLKRRQLEKEIQVLESETGKELVYAVFTTKDFEYRLSACDKFVRDILDYPHEKILNQFADLF